MKSVVPVILFAYARPHHLQRTLDCLAQNRVPLIYAYCDGPATPANEIGVVRVREMLRAVNWCDVVLHERESNFGLGRSILTGVADVLRTHDCAVVFEDDLICVPGTYDYVCAALGHYRDCSCVMSVTGWTHPLITPSDVVDQPYFDGRAECLVWGTWARAWEGMTETAKELTKKCVAAGIDKYAYGADLPAMAEIEQKNNIWAVRFLYLHILKRALCLRPPWSMVEHIGFDTEATNAKKESWIKNPPLKPCPRIPSQWPEPAEHPACRRLHQAVCGTRPTLLRKIRRFCLRLASKTLRTLSPGNP